MRNFKGDRLARRATAPKGTREHLRELLNRKSLLRAKLSGPVTWPEEIRGMDMDYWWTDPLADELGDE